MPSTVLSLWPKRLGPAHRRHPSFQTIDACTGAISDVGETAVTCFGVDGETYARRASEVQPASRLNTGRPVVLADLVGCWYTGQPVSSGY